MSFRIEFDPQARVDLKKLRAFERTATLDAIERFLTRAPTAIGRTRIKRLRGLDSPEYRLRVGEIRVFYDVSDDEVYVLRVLAKADTTSI